MPKFADCLKIKLDKHTQFLKVIDTYNNSGDHIKRVVADPDSIVAKVLKECVEPLFDQEFKRVSIPFMGDLPHGKIQEG